MVKRTVYGTGVVPLAKKKLYPTTLLGGGVRLISGYIVIAVGVVPQFTEALNPVTHMNNP